MESTENFDSAAARIWKNGVDEELNSVKALLQEVADVTTTPAGSDDGIMKAIEAIGTNERVIWENVTSAFTETSEKTGGIIAAFEKFGEGAYEKISSIISKRS